MNYYDRLIKAGPTGKMIADILDDLIDGINAVINIVAVGQDPHKVEDAANVVALTDAGSLDDIVDLEQQAIAKYTAHIGSTTYHAAADTTNTVTEVGVPTEVYTLLNELKTDYEAHRVRTAGGTHAGADSTNTISAANATTKATAIALANNLRAAFIANFANVTAHHGADGSVDAPTSPALLISPTWSEIVALTDELRASYEAHRVRLTSVHGVADSTNVVSSATVGAIQTAVNAGLNELKGDFNAHIAESGTSHYIRDTSMRVGTADASTLNTSRTLVNALKRAINDHISRASETALGSLPKLNERF